ncbi:MAG TPA: hypothetical protein VNZ86_20125, partial [Bacteroidia bacterium]|nr:hypothetical protein [Bacteroidia bacterium]
MKKRFLFFFLFIPVFLSAQNIPNFDFESWNFLNYYFPIPWNTAGTITRLSPGYQGNYALRMQGNLNTGEPGQISLGKLLGNQYSGGVPFNSRPDTVSGFYAYNIATGDSASLFLILKNNGSIVGSDTMYITGSNPGFYVHKTSGIHYRSALTPDSVIIVVNSTRLNHLNTASYVMIDDLTLMHQSLLIPDGDFESWYHKDYFDLVGWTTPNFDGLSANAYPVKDTTLHLAGRYSARLMNISEGSYYLPGYILLGKASGNNIFPGIASGVLDTVLTGFYQFFPQNGD